MALNLTVKACTRLRRSELSARKFSLSVKTINRHSWASDKLFSPTQDNFTIAKALDDMWRTMQAETGKAKLIKVSVMLHDLFESKDITLDLFDTPSVENNTANNLELSKAMDTLNRKFGGNVVNIGSCPQTNEGYVGTKVAFTRIPELEEFNE